MNNHNGLEDCISFYEIFVSIRNLVFRPKIDTLTSKTKPLQDNKHCFPPDFDEQNIQTFGSL